MSAVDTLPSETAAASPVDPLARRAGRARVGIALPLVLGIIASLAAALTLDDVGVTWDEPDYLTAAKLHVRWIGELPGRAAAGTLRSWVSADSLEAYWHHDPYHNPHPPLYKVLGGLTWAALHDRLGDYTAFRLATALLFGLLVGVLCRWGWQAAAESDLLRDGACAAGSTPVAVLTGGGAGVALLCMPRVFGDAHIAATDLPLAAFWSAAAYFFWRSIVTGGTSSVVLFGAFWGMALATKLHGLLLPVPLAAWALVHAPRRLPRTLLVGGVMAAAALVLFDPYLWPDPLGRYLAFLRASTTRNEWARIPTFYGGQMYPFVLPWHHALVLTAVTVPLPLLALAAAGTSRIRDRARRGVVGLCLVEVVFFLALMALPSSPGHNGVRLFLPMFPFVALLAGIGFAAVVEHVGSRLEPRRARAATAVAAVAAVGVFLVPAVVASVRAHPHELAYFNEVTGGARGASARGFESTYWFDAANPNFLRRLEQALPTGARVWAHPAPWHYTKLQEAGLLRADLVFTDELPAPFLLLMSYQGTFGVFEWKLHELVHPILTESYDGVPLIALYRGWR